MLSLLRCCRHGLSVTAGSKMFNRQLITVSNKMEILLKKADNIPRDYNMIYRITNHRSGAMMYHSLNFFIFTTVGAIGYIFYTGASPDASAIEDVHVDDLLKEPWKLGLILFVSAALLVMTTVVRGRYVIRIYHNENTKTYRAIFIGKIPFTNEFYEFPQGQAIFVAKDSKFPWRNSLLKVNKKKILLFEDNFKTHNDFYSLLKPGQL
ncbi:hypothetical protein TKK_0001572 [Trichogramma kaykai]|uniref:Transmembrane protein 223 n=1 Tax=Trichogramma kaykai TaxID=54128 RepID=A0ABD2VRV2_9HYME